MAFSPAIKAFIEYAGEKESVASQLFSVVRDAGAREGLRLSKNDIRSAFLNGGRAEGDMLVFLGVLSGDDSARSALSNAISGVARDEGFGVMPFDAASYLLDIAAASDVPVSRALPAAGDAFGRSASVTCAMGEEGEPPYSPPQNFSVTCAMGEEDEAPRKPDATSLAVGEEEKKKKNPPPLKRTTKRVGEETKKPRKPAKPK